MRTVVDCDLMEVSVCREPAYRSSEVVAGSMRIDRFLKTIDSTAERERRLAEAEATIATWRAAKIEPVNQEPAVKVAKDFIEEDNEFLALVWLTAPGGIVISTAFLPRTTRQSHS